eukprot:gene57001-biopygen118455
METPGAMTALSLLFNNPLRAAAALPPQLAALRALSDGWSARRGDHRRSPVTRFQHVQVRQHVTAGVFERDDVLPIAAVGVRVAPCPRRSARVPLSERLANDFPDRPNFFTVPFPNFSSCPLHSGKSFEDTDNERPDSFTIPSSDTEVVSRLYAAQVPTVATYTVVIPSKVPSTISPVPTWICVVGHADNAWGGYCNCPDGNQYAVGDNYDACGSLACAGCTQSVEGTGNDSTNVICAMRVLSAHCGFHRWSQPCLAR